LYLPVVTEKAEGAAELVTLDSFVCAKVFSMEIIPKRITNIFILKLVS